MLMRRPLQLTASCVLGAILTLSGGARADTMDPALARLVSGAGCRARGPGGFGAYYNPASGFTPCTLDDQAFAELVSGYSFAISPTAMHPAHTTGYSGVEFGVEATFTTLDGSRPAWQLGTQGPLDSSTGKDSVRNASPDSVLQQYNLKLRKGFPYGFELQAVVGYLNHTSMLSGGADVRWALFEGFRKGFLGYLPDLSVGGSVRTMTGNPDLMLSIAGVDAQLSKPFTVGSASVLSPWVGYQWTLTYGDSGLIDVTPNTDALNSCGYTGSNSPANPDPRKTDSSGLPYHDGEAVCAPSGTSADLNNNLVFAPLVLARHRLQAGLELKHRRLSLGGQFMTDLMSPAEANPDALVTLVDPSTGEVTTKNRLEGVPKQWQVSLSVGAVF
jgi:hypothetical protein